jgi:hypothetical protein
MKKLVLVALAILLVPLAFVDAQQKMFLNIATGGTAGTYYPLGGAMAEIINKNVSEVNATAVSTGASVANINMLATDEVQMIMVQNDVTYYAFTGTEMFKDKKQPNLCGVSTLYYETIQVVTLVNAGIRSLSDLKGKRIAVGAAGSGTEANARQILEAVGITYNDIRPQYLSFAEAANGLRDGNVDVAFLTAGAPTAAVRDVAAQRDVMLVPIPQDVAARIIQKYPFYAVQKLPAGTYPKQDAEIGTLAVKAMLVVSANLPEQTAYNITRAIYTNLDRLALAHAVGRVIKKETAMEGMPIPLHPGAERFLKAK